MSLIRRRLPTGNAAEESGTRRSLSPGSRSAAAAAANRH